jgi:hypothetical protein
MTGAGFFSFPHRDRLCLPPTLTHGVRRLMSILKKLIPEVIPGQKCHINMGPILNSYGDTGI